jgi:ABC-type nitrate/sulfonate/bicarbonate transport system permease component
MRGLATARRGPRVATRPHISLALRRRRRTLTGGLAVALFLAVWQLVGSWSLVRVDLISYPTQLLAVGASLVASGELGRHALISLQEFVYGFAPAVVVGILLGLAMGQFRRLRYLLDPLVMALYTAPRIALIPILVVWFGVGMESKVAVVFLGAVFPILVNTLAGVQQVDPLWVRAARAFGASQLQVVVRVVLPGALPAVMAGLRLGLGRAILGVIVGEMYVSVAGMGQLIQVYGSAGRVAELVVLATIVAGFGLLCITALRRVEERIGPWRRELEL